MMKPKNHPIYYTSAIIAGLFALSAYTYYLPVTARKERVAKIAQVEAIARDYIPEFPDEYSEALSIGLKEIRSIREACLATYGLLGMRSAEMQHPLGEHQGDKLKKDTTTLYRICATELFPD